MAEKIYGGFAVREYHDSHDHGCEEHSKGIILVKAESAAEARSLILKAYWADEAKYTSRTSKKFPYDRFSVFGLKEGKALAKKTGFSAGQLEAVLDDEE